MCDSAHHMSHTVHVTHTCTHACGLRPGLKARARTRRTPRASTSSTRVSNAAQLAKPRTASPAGIRSSPRYARACRTHTHTMRRPIVPGLGFHHCACAPVRTMACVGVVSALLRQDRCCTNGATPVYSTSAPYYTPVYTPPPVTPSGQCSDGAGTGICQSWQVAFFLPRFTN